MQNKKFSALTAITLATAMALSACGGGSASAQSTSFSGAVPASSTPASGPTTVATTYSPAGNAGSVEGIDSANRGYRDDVQQLIDDKYSSNPVVHAAVEVSARNSQTSIKASTLAMTDTSPVVLASSQLTGCAASTVPFSQKALYVAAIQAVYARTFNMDARMAARQSYLAKATSVGLLSYDPTKCATASGVN
ncbi:hypothetical protein OKW34_000135 [Paraburkholderia youngii]|uniref:hypothetical protein n=1 Tax=Paraburkholderia youngii TaxID=2782701 RepID=UPI003D2530EE